MCILHRLQISPSCCGSATHYTFATFCRSAALFRSDVFCRSVVSLRIRHVLQIRHALHIHDVLQARDVRHSSCSGPISTSVNICQAIFECLHVVFVVVWAPQQRSPLLPSAPEAPPVHLLHHQGHAGVYLINGQTGVALQLAILEVLAPSSRAPFRSRTRPLHTKPDN